MRRECMWPQAVRLLGVVVVGVAACAPRAPVGVGDARHEATEAVVEGATEVVRVHEANVTCARALRAARDALRSLGYSIDAVEPARAAASGRVVALRREGWSARSPEGGAEFTTVARVSCDDTGATVAVSTEESGMARFRFPAQFRGAFREALAQVPAHVRAGSVAPGRVDRRQEPERGLVVEVQPLRADPPPGVDGQLDAYGVIAVRIAIRNGTNRAFTFDPDGLRMVTVEGRRRGPLSAGELRRRVGEATAEALSRAAFVSGTIEPGAERSGHVYFEVATFARAVLRLTDVESGEAEGFSVRF